MEDPAGMPVRVSMGGLWSGVYPHLPGSMRDGYGVYEYGPSFPTCMTLHEEV